jgi:hypothetical protein
MICNYKSYFTINFLEIDREKFRLQGKWLGFTRTVAEGNSADLLKCEIRNSNCQLIAGIQSYFFGDKLTPIEKKWLAEEVDEFLNREIFHCVNRSLIQPAGSKINLQKTDDRLIVDIPPITGNWFLIMNLIMPLPLFFFSHFFMSSMLSTIETPLLIMIPMYLILYLIYVICFSAIIVPRSHARNYLKINREKFCLQKKYFGVTRTVVEGNTADLEECELVNSNFQLIEGVRTHRVLFMLTQIEKEWLMAEVNDFLAKLNR